MRILEHKKMRDENGIAIILSLIMLLIMSALAVTVSFMSNIDFQTMSNYKQGQEAFLAAERCIEEGRRRLEVIGVETLSALIQSGTSSGSTSLNLKMGAPGVNCNTSPEKCSVCRAGTRSSASETFLELPPITKESGRPIRNVSIEGARALSTTFVVTGKDARDKDKDDSNVKINTGTEISAGFEVFIPGGELNAY